MVVSSLALPYQLSLKSLRAFIVLAEEMSFGRAASQLRVAQPALSQQIREIERRIGAELFDRKTRPLQLTQAGLYFQIEARELIAKLDDAVAGARAIGSGQKGWIGLGFTRSAMYEYLPPVIKSFVQAHPSVELRLFELLAEQQPEALRTGKIHLGIARDPQEITEFKQELISEERLVAVLPMGHRLSRRNAIKLVDLVDEPFIFFPKTPGARFPAKILDLCRIAGFTPRVAQAAQEIQTAMALVAAGLGVTVVSQVVMKHGRRDLIYKNILEGKQSLLTSLFAQYRFDDPSPSLADLLDSMRRARGTRRRELPPVLPA